MHDGVNVSHAVKSLFRLTYQRTRCTPEAGLNSREAACRRARSTPHRRLSRPLDVPPRPALASRKPLLPLSAIGALYTVGTSQSIWLSNIHSLVITGQQSADRVRRLRDYAALAAIVP